MTDRIGQQWWEEYFAPGGGWERGDGPAHTRIFAQAFTRRLRINRHAPLSILDVGCALGGAIRHFREFFPNATLHGIDFSDTAIERCRAELGGIATFEARDIGQIEGRYDLIYTSNVLEHFADFEDKARVLIGHTSRLCILTPYKERQRDGQFLAPDEREHHQHSFHKASFDFLIKEELAKSIRVRVFSCPGAWGWDLRKKIYQRFWDAVAWLRQGKIGHEPRQIFYDIKASPKSFAPGP